MSGARARRRSWLSWAAITLLLLFGPGAYQLVRLTLVQRQLDRQLAVVAAERERLTREQERLESDPAYVEGLIRSTFKLAEPGEYVIPIEPLTSHALADIPREARPASR